MERMKCQESRQQTERGAVDAPQRKRINRQQLQQQLLSPKHKNNLRLHRNKAERVSFGTPQGDETAK